MTHSSALFFEKQEAMLQQPMFGSLCSLKAKILTPGVLVNHSSIYPYSQPKQDGYNTCRLILLIAMARLAYGDLTSSTVQSNCLLSKFILLHVTFCFSVSITVYVIKKNLNI